MSTSALLALEDGSLFYGELIGGEGIAVGEIVFNTAMTGYQEVLSDPSYAGQLVALTYPHIGNVGCHSQDNESCRSWAAGAIIRDVSIFHSNWRAEQSFPDYLKSQHLVGISEIDTRRLTRLIRDKGILRGCITAEIKDPAKAVEIACRWPSTGNQDLVRRVSTQKIYQSTQLTDLPSQVKHHIVAYDFGIKRTILRLLADYGCQVTVVPATTSVREIHQLQPTGIFLSNGPGDPAACDYAINTIGELLACDIPVFGICLGFQLLALASGAKTCKMKFGHHGINHPVLDLQTQRVFITSQNHGFVVDESSLPNTLEITHRSLFDNTIQGLKRKDKKAFGFQGHPEGSPGTHDLAGLFDQFMDMQNAKTY